MRATVVALLVSIALAGCGDDDVDDASIDGGADAGVPLDSGAADGGADAGAPLDAGGDAAVGCSPACGACEDCVDGGCVSIGGPHPAAAVSSGWYHLLAIDRDGHLFCWGENDNGQLGLGDHEDRYVATQLGSDQWIAADGGSRHSCAVRNDHTLWCFGANVHGQLGLGDDVDRDVPTQVGTDTDWVGVACGGLHTCGVKADGTAWCWGSNAAGQLGLGARDGDEYDPVQVVSGTTWSILTAQTRHTCGLLADDTLWCWGDNSNGQLGQDDRDDRRSPLLVMSAGTFREVGTGARHTCAIDTSSELWCWGANDTEQLGLGDAMDRGVPVRVGSDSDWSGIKGIASGFEHTCGLRAGSLWCWGDGAKSQLGVGDTTRYSSPQRVGTAEDWEQVVAGYYHSCGLSSAGTVRCWGDNVHGQQGGGVDVGVAQQTPADVCFGPL